VAARIIPYRVPCSHPARVSCSSRLQPVGGRPSPSGI
jgi:hypothetical protein